MDPVSCYHECSINLQILLRNLTLIYKYKTFISDTEKHDLLSWFTLGSSPNRFSDDFRGGVGEG